LVLVTSIVRSLTETKYLAGRALDELVSVDRDELAGRDGSESNRDPDPRLTPPPRTACPLVEIGSTA
jgi:hypothetical protein